MIKNTFEFKTNQIVFIVLLGTSLRLIYGVYSRIWLGAPDQIVWELSLSELINSGNWSYKQLMHYPHEGGSLFLSILALPFVLLKTTIPALTIVALLVDTCSRFLEIIIVKKLFGALAAFWYGIWSVIALPILLCWSNVNFGLHYLSSIWPFIFLYGVISLKKNQSILCGLIVGLSIFFSYSSVIFLPVYILWRLYKIKTFNEFIFEITKFLTVVFLVLIPHLCLRIFVDSGFHLEKLAIGEIREFTFSDLISIHNLKHLPGLALKALPASFFLADGSVFFSILQRLIVLLFLALAFFYGWQHKEKLREKYSIIILLIGTYLIVYALSPFYSAEASSVSYYEYRHLSYILPFMIMALIVVYVNSGKLGNYILAVLLFCCLIFSGYFIIKSQPLQNKNYRVEGWILARKYGDSPEKLIQINKLLPPEKQKEMMIGFGWGITAAMFSKKDRIDKSLVIKLENIYEAFPVNMRASVMIGIDTAFAPGITPVINKEYLESIHQTLNQ